MTPEALAQVMEATWPPFRAHRTGPWLIRNGAGGGKRVSAATAEADWDIPDITLAEHEMRALGQPPLFLIRDGDAALDATLAARGYTIIDPVMAYTIDAHTLPPPAPMTTFPHWPPLSIARTLWAEGGIGPARLAVMDRVQGPKTAILGRTGDRPAGVAFVAMHGTTAMLHALEVSPRHRRQGSAQNILNAAAAWTVAHQGDTLSLVVTEANVAARRLYASRGMQVVGKYHYRQS
jgi:ribosomal protein S18 acetylase RimI-like enzyme